jgi:hypothetical protein
MWKERQVTVWTDPRRPSARKSLLQWNAMILHDTPGTMPGSKHPIRGTMHRSMFSDLLSLISWCPFPHRCPSKANEYFVHWENHHQFSAMWHFSTLPFVIGRRHQFKAMRDASAISTDSHCIYIYKLIPSATLSVYEMLVHVKFPLVHIHRSWMHNLTVSFKIPWIPKVLPDCKTLCLGKTNAIQVDYLWHRLSFSTSIRGFCWLPLIKWVNNWIYSLNISFQAIFTGLVSSTYFYIIYSYCGMRTSSWISSLTCH